MKTREFSRLLPMMLILILACDKKDSTTTGPGTESSVLVPLVAGNQWTYTDSTFSSGSVSVDSSMLVITGSSSIQYQGQAVEVFHWNWLNNRTLVPQDWKWLCRNESDGLYMYGGKSIKGTYQLGRSLSQKYPASVGDTWQNISFLYSTSDSMFRVGDTLTIQCIATSEQVVTPAGVFTAQVATYHRSYTVGTTLMTSDIYLYYVPNVGYIGLTEKQGGQVTYRKLLRAYHVVRA